MNEMTLVLTIAQQNCSKLIHLYLAPYCDQVERRVRFLSDCERLQQGIILRNLCIIPFQEFGLARGQIHNLGNNMVSADISQGGKQQKKLVSVTTLKKTDPIRLAVFTDTKIFAVFKATVLNKDAIFAIKVAKYVENYDICLKKTCSCLRYFNYMPFRQHGSNGHGQLGATQMHGSYKTVCNFQN